MTDATDIHAAIIEADKDFMVAFNKGDAAGVAALYTENAQFMPPHSDFVKGRTAIQAVFQSLMDMGIKTIRLEATEVNSYGGQTASEVGTYVLEGADGQLLDRGKFLVIWKQEAGVWRLHRDMINTSMPVPQ